MPSASDIVGTVLGLLGLVSIVQLVQAGLEYNLPRRWLKILDETIDSTESLFRDAVEEGIPLDIIWIKYIESQLNDVQEQADDLRADSHLAMRASEQWKAMWKGLSRDIRALRGRVVLLRARIAEGVDRERRRLLAGETTRYNYDLVGGLQVPRRNRSHASVKAPSLKRHLRSRPGSKHFTASTLSSVDSDIESLISFDASRVELNAPASAVNRAALASQVQDSRVKAGERVAQPATPTAQSSAQQSQAIWTAMAGPSQVVAPARDARALGNMLRELVSTVDLLSSTLSKTETSAPPPSSAQDDPYATIAAVHKRVMDIATGQAPSVLGPQAAVSASIQEIQNQGSPPSSTALYLTSSQSLPSPASNGAHGPPEPFGHVMASTGEQQVPSATLTKLFVRHHITELPTIVKSPDKPTPHPTPSR